MKLRSTGLVALAATAGLLLAGCGTDAGASKASDRAPQSGQIAVSAADNSFRDQDITITAGSKVTWSNDGRNDHNVKPVDGGDFGVDTKDFKPGATYQATFSTPGTYHYYCTIHGTADKGMVGSVEVVAP